MREFFVEKLRNRRRKKLYSKQIIQKEKKFLSSRVNQIRPFLRQTKRTKGNEQFQINHVPRTNLP